MDENLEKKLKNFNNLPDIRKFEELSSISEQEIDENTLEFLFKVFEKEKYEKIRIVFSFSQRNSRGAKNSLSASKIATIFSSLIPKGTRWRFIISFSALNDEATTKMASL